MKTKLIILSFFLLINQLTHGQSYAQYSHLNFEQDRIIDDYYIRNPAFNFHSGQRPYLHLSIENFEDSTFSFQHFRVKNYFLSKTFFEDPRWHNDVTFKIHPIIDQQTGFDALENRVVNESSGGINTRFDINQDFSAYLTAFGGTMSLPNFTDTIVKSWQVIPGLGIAYKNGNGYNYFYNEGYLSYNPIKVVNLTAGKGKQFIGDGYRSLLLSDIAGAYPYFKTTVNIWHIQYSCWYSWFKDIYQTNGMISKSRNRYGTSHFLSWNITEDFNFSLFESEIWQGTDTNRNRGFDPNYLNPVIFYRPVEYSIGSSDNAILGLNTSYKFLKQFKVYGQLVLDEFYLKEIRAQKGWWANKQGYQIGLKYINAFSVKNLSIQAEYNTVRPYTYTHGSPQQNYSHLNQPLAHPLGANFSEINGWISYRKGAWSIDVRGVFAKLGTDSINAKKNVGQNIFLSYVTRYKEYGNYTGQGIKTNLAQSDIKIAYLLIPSLNLRAELGYIQRMYSRETGTLIETPFIYFGIKSSLHNFYRDY